MTDLTAGKGQTRKDLAWAISVGGIGFVLFAACAGAVLALLGWMQSRWTRTWAGRGGRAMVSP